MFLAVAGNDTSLEYAFMFYSISHIIEINKGSKLRKLYYIYI